MFLILKTINNLSNFCSSIVLYNTLSIIKKSLTIIQIIGPICTMVSLAISFTLLTANPDEKKHQTRIKNSLIATVILFLLPALVNLIMSLPVIEQNTTVGQCWASVDANSKRIK